MDTQHVWQAFAQTGNILTYLDYKKQADAAAAVPPQEDSGYGTDRNAGAGAPRGQV